MKVSLIYSHWCNKQFEKSDSEYDSEICNPRKQLEQSHPTPLSQSDIKKK